jgi:hypothetical protein
MSTTAAVSTALTARTMSAPAFATVALAATESTTNGGFTDPGRMSHG